MKPYSTAFFVQKSVDLSHANHQGDTALHKAVRQANIEATRLFCKTLIRDNISIISIRNAKGYSVVHEAAVWNQHLILEMLMSEFKLDVDAVDYEGNSALHLTADERIVGPRSPIETTQILLKYNANVNLKNNKGSTALHNHFTPPEKFDLLLQAGCKIDGKDNAGQTAFFVCCLNAKVAQAETIMRNDRFSKEKEFNDINSATNNIDMPKLLAAAIKQNRFLFFTEFFKMLDSKQKVGLFEQAQSNTFLNLIFEQDCGEALEALINDKNIEWKLLENNIFGNLSKQSKSAFEIGIENGSVICIGELLKRDLIKHQTYLDIIRNHIFEQDKTSFLHRIVKFGSIELLKLFVEKANCNVNYSNYLINTQEKNKQEEEEEEDNENDNSDEYEDNGTPLHLSCQIGNLEIVKELVALGSDINR